MSSLAIDAPAPPAGEAVDAPMTDGVEYRAIHTGSIIALLLGILSISLWPAASSSLSSCLLLLPIPLAAIVVAVLALRTLSERADQYTGRPLAVAGLVLACLFLVTGTAYAGWVYATEVPEGYRRLTFLDLKPDQFEERAGEAIPSDILDSAKAGEPVFIKGYIRPDSIDSRKGIRRFLLVRDNNTCCFGEVDKVKYYDQILVGTVGDLATDYHGGVFRVAGRLSVLPQNTNLGPGYPVYLLQADHIQD